MDQPVAIVGMACRFPGGISNPEKLWQTLAEGRNCWTNVPKDRFNEEAFFHPNPDFRGGHNHRGGHFLGQNVAAFDAQFFGLSATEVSSMDPQQRLLLELSYEAFESGGLPIESVRGSDTAVYVAAFTHDYDRNLSKDLDDIPKYHITGTGEAIMANRISYLFDLHGPSMTLDTGCSGSLVALHQGCQNLWTGESNMVLVAGVNLMLTPDHMIGMSNFNMLNEQGKSFAFDHRGSGYGRGEGCAAVILRRLDDAVRCNDPIRAVILGTGVNQDGKTPGITRPDSEAQASLAEAVLRKSGVHPREIGYIEAHGTGTMAGDIAEMQSIAKVYCHERMDSVYVGSIKSNIGHLESVSGLAGLLKGVLVIEKGYIPPQAHLAHLKPELQVDDLNVKIPRKLVAWPYPQERLVSVNSFGYGGTNAYVVLKQAPGVAHVNNTRILPILGDEDKGVQGRIELFTVSAKSAQSLKQNLINLQAWLVSQSQHSDVLPRDLAFTLGARRTTFDWRSSFVAASSAELSEALDQATRKEAIHKALSEPRIVFLFTGQGAQWAGMGRQLIAPDSPFRISLLKSEAVLKRLGAPWHLIEELQVENHESRIDQSDLAQPICTALQIALVDLLGSYGIKPLTVVGHSSGEIAAAYASGILSQESALEVAYYRGFVSSICRRSMSSKGAMLAVGLGSDEVEGLLSQISTGKISIACVNSLSSTTVSGDEEGINELQHLLNSKSVRNRRLNVDTAYHSHHMLAASEWYQECLKGMKTYAPGQVRFVSTVTGAEKLLDFGADYWVANLTSTVKYRQAVQYVLRTETLVTTMPATSLVFVEIGPHKVLTPLTREIVRTNYPRLDCQCVPTLLRESGAIRTVLETVGKLFEAGLQIDLNRVFSLTATEGSTKCIPELPPYAWDHSETYWHESRLSKDYRFRRYPYHDLLGVRIPGSTPIEPRWRNLISIESQPWLQDHKVDDQVVFPGAAYMCMAIEAKRQTMEDHQNSKRPSTYVLRDVSFSKALTLQKQSKKTEMQLSLSPLSKAHKSSGESWLAFRITAMDLKGTWAEYCSGLVGIVEVEPGNTPLAENENSTIFEAQNWNSNRPCQGGGELLTADKLYHGLKKCGNDYGPAFAMVKELRTHTPDRATALVEIPDISSMMPYHFMQPLIIHPTTLDALMHSSLPLYREQKGDAFIMPLSVEEFRIASDMETKPGTQLGVSSIMRPEGSRGGVVDLLATNGKAITPLKPVVQISNLRIRGFTYANKDSMSMKLPVWTTNWEPVADLSKISDLRAHAGGFQRPIEVLRNEGLEKGRSGDGAFQVFVSGLQRWASNVTETSWEGLLLDKNSIYVVLDDGNRPILANLSEQSLGKLITLFTSEASILWISLSTHSTASTNPEKSLVNGFARSAHAENDGLQLFIMDIQQPWATCCDVVLDVVAGFIGRNLTFSHGSDRNRDREFVFRDGQILRPRIVQAPGPTGWLLGAGNSPSTDGSLGTGLVDIKMPMTNLDSDATYIVAGGLGFIGRRLCQLMVNRGARHLVVLSRRRLSAPDEKGEVDKLQAIAPAVRVHYLACDVSVPADVEAAKSSLVATGFPPVKGVIQSTVVLIDRLLARMTLHDFNGPLQTKLHGTRNLSQTFQSDALDFFVSLSSATAAVGTRGQANYTAGNTFQDAFAYGHTSPKTHYMSVSPGIIEGADINDGVRERNLRQHGLVPVSIDVLMSLLEYSMSPQARLDNCKHAIVGFTKESLSQVGIRNANVHSAMFSRVIETTADSQPVSGNDDPKSLKESIKAIKDPVQIKHLIVTATVKKLAELVSAQDTGAMLHKPLEDLGLDSLMTLELSDWTLQNCGVSIGPSELMNMDHASALADFIYDRSAIVKETEIFESDKAGRDNASELGTTSPPTDKR